jgi:hypothetical protein
MSREIKNTNMKTISICLIATFFAFNSLFSQDVLTKKSGEDIQAKVLEVTTTEVKYKKFDNLNGPIFSILKSDLLLIRYENGSKDIFTDNKKVEEKIVSGKDFYLEGQSDANRFYRGYKGAGNGVLATSLLLSPLVGLIPAAICASADPKDENLDYPSSDLMKNSEYANGYRQKAKKIKQKKVWTNLGVAFGINLVLILALSSGE